MKKIILVAFLAVSFIRVHAQEAKSAIDVQKQNEVKINGLYLVLGALEVTYERLLNEESGVGLSIFLPIDDAVNDGINYYVSPYYRFYFGKKYAAGFFVEGFGMLNSYDYTTIGFLQSFDAVASDTENVTDFALGIGVGGKWITNRGMFAEVNFGVGRNLFNSNDFSDYEVIGKASIAIGIRF